MKVKHRYTFRIDDSTKKILDLLEKNNIKYKVSDGIPIMVFTVYEENNKWEEIEELMKKYGGTSLTECIYSNEEINNAEWLRIRSKWRSEYPQSEDNYKKNTYDDSDYCKNCGCGLVQKGAFRLKKAPRWGKKNFLMLNWIEDELFVNNELIEKISKGHLKGFNIKPVLNYKTNEPIENIKQIKVLHTLNPGIVINEEDVKKVIQCTKCQTKKYVLKNNREITYKREIFKKMSGIDIVKSYEVFGDGMMCAKKIFISQKFYNKICEEETSKELVVEPLKLV